MPRRRFLELLGTSVAVPICKSAVAPDLRSDWNEISRELRANLLEMVNEERTVEKVGPVELDSLATEVATTHAEDMATGEFTSHWGRNGLKPYHRYSFAGGYHATQENVSAANHTWSTKLADLKLDTSYLHVRMYQETPPSDGHRQTILAPQHTHVGIGLAVNELRLRMVELFVAKHVELTPVARVVSPGSQFTISGRLLKSSYSLKAIEVFYEASPTPPELSWLRQARSYSLPDESQVLRPILPPPNTYVDRQPGVIKIDSSGNFQTPVRLFKNSAGIYTIVCWVKRSRNEKPFPATELCIRAE